jgi:hypothetical protein
LRIKKGGWRSATMSFGRGVTHHLGNMQHKQIYGYIRLLPGPCCDAFDEWIELMANKRKK